MHGSIKKSIYMKRKEYIVEFTFISSIMYLLVENIIFKFVTHYKPRRACA